jgi:hypothetical protein
MPVNSTSSVSPDFERRLWDYTITQPHCKAVANLSFFPIGAILPANQDELCELFHTHVNQTLSTLSLRASSRLLERNQKYHGLSGRKSLSTASTVKVKRQFG